MLPRLALAALALAAAVPAPGPRLVQRGPLQVLEGDGPPRVADRVLVRLRPGATGWERLPGHPDLALVRFPADSGRGIDRALVGLRGHPDVLHAEPDYLLELAGTPDDPRYAQQWALPMIGAPAAWDVQTGSTAIRVAVLDTGCDYNHPDLAANLWVNSAEIPGNGIDDDSNGYVDDVRGWDFGDGDSDPMDPFGHGTNVAGILGAVGDNGAGVAGVCWRVEIVVVKIVSSSWAVTVSAAVQGLAYARRAGARLVNASWGVGAYSQVLHDEMLANEEAGMLFVAAAGNAAADLDAAPSYPACDPLASVICVGASTPADELWANSNRGAASVDLAAPGVDIHSTFPMGLYYSMSGTSQAAPHVSGACALVWAAHPLLTAAQVKARILAGADPIAGPVTRRLNVAGALAATDAPDPVSPPPPGGGGSSGGKCGSLGVDLLLLPALLRGLRWLSAAASRRRAKPGRR